MSYTQDVNTTDVCAALRSAIISVFGSAINDVIQIPTDRAPMPKKSPYATMSDLTKTMIHWPVPATSDPSVQPQSNAITAATDYEMQICFYGAGASDMAEIFHTFMRSPDAFDFFNALTPAGVYPLYADTPYQANFVNGEAEYELRWIMNVHLQYNPTITATIQTASAATVLLINAEASYH